MAPISDFHVVIPAGGAGTRLWPLSRAGHPKFLLDLTGSGRSLLQQTWDRLLPLAGAGAIGVATGEKHVAAVQNQLPDLASENLWVEPSPRDSMAAIGLAAAILARRHGPESLLGSFAADHVIGDQESFQNAVSAATAAAREGFIVTLGIRATQPSTAFGYIRAGEELPGGRARKVTEFVEKPDPETAVEYLATGEYFWNAGMFIFRTGVLLEHLARLQPQLHAGLTEIAAAWDTAQRAAALQRLWPSLTRIAIDHAIAEPVAAAGGVAVVAADFTWDDVGDWAALRDILPAAANTVLGSGSGREPLILDGAANLIVPAGERQVVLLGLDDVVVVDTPDAVLVAHRESAQRVKDAVDALRATEREELL